MAIPGLGEISYHLPFYMKYVEKITQVLQQLKKKGKEMNVTNISIYFITLLTWDMPHCPFFCTTVI